MSGYAETVIIDAKVGQVSSVVSALDGVEGVAIWVTEIGILNRVYLFRTAGTHDALLERRPKLLARIPSDCARHVDVTSWRLISPLLSEGEHGSAYEWRCYELKLGHISEVERAFVDALAPRLALSPLVCGMISLEGVPRLAHIWPYQGLEERRKVRAKAVETGVWPPKIASALERMENAVLVPVRGSAWR